MQIFLYDTAILYICVLMPIGRRGGGGGRRVKFFTPVHVKSGTAEGGDLYIPVRVSEVSSVYADS